MIHTDRLSLRQFVPEDWQDLHEYLSQAETVRFEPYETFSLDQAKEAAIRRSEDDSFWAVVLHGQTPDPSSVIPERKPGKVIGNIWMSKGDFDTWELGYVFNQNYWGRGYATEACRAMLLHAFTACKAHRVTAFVDQVNTSSWKLLERLGMRREGHLLQNVYFEIDPCGEPSWKDTYEYGVLASDWLRS